MGLSRIGQLTQIGKQVIQHASKEKAAVDCIFNAAAPAVSRLSDSVLSIRESIMSISTETELINFGSSLHLRGDSTSILNLLNTRMREIKELTQLKRQIASSESIQEINRLLAGRTFSPKEAQELQSIVNTKRAELMRGIQRLSHHAVANLEHVQAALGSMFERAYTLEEANETARAYKEAFAQTETTSFFTKMYKQLLKDYRFGTSDIPVEGGNCDGAYACFGILDGLTVDRFAIYSDNYHMREYINKSHIFKCFAHELKHAYQTRIACGADFIGFIKAEVENNFKNISTSPMAQRILRQNNDNVQRAMIQMEQELKELILPFLKNARQIPQSSPLYTRGLAYIENTRNYKHFSNAPYHEYKGQLLEREAFRVGDLAEELYALLT